MRYNPPPNWPQPPSGWTPPGDWRPDPSWPAPPAGWEIWLRDESDEEPTRDSPPPLEADLASSPEDVPGGNEAELRERIAYLERRIFLQEASPDVVNLSDTQVLQESGVYQYNHPLDNAPAYKARLDELRQQILDFIRSDNAILAAESFTLDNSPARGRQMLRDMKKLMLRAYNAEADNCVRAMRAGNLPTAAKRLNTSRSTIERLGSIMQIRINPDFHALRILELELTADFQMKKQEERELERAQREELREQRRAERELAEQREKLEKEKAHYLSALQALQSSDDHAGMDDLRKRLEQIEEAIEQNDYRSANIRAGYVYVISNVGAFGPGVVKIGLTRRLEPRDRVRELGDASVPFPYDVHALFFSNDAVTLEAELHQAFENRRVNNVNQRREFFFAHPNEVREVLSSKVGGLLEFTGTPEALEYRQSLSGWPLHHREMGPQ